MTSPIRGILNSTLDKDKLNILCMDTHERYQSNLAKTGHNFFSIKEKSKGWNTEYAPIPNNYTHVNSEYFYHSFIHQIDFDIILSQHKFGQYQMFKQLSNMLHVPLVSLEHTVPNDTAAPEKVNYYRQLRGHKNVYLWDYSRKEWNSQDQGDSIIYHGMDLNFWKPLIPVEKRPAKTLTVVNDFINRDRECGYSVWKYVTDGTPSSAYGSTPGLSKAAKSVNELVSIYNNHQIYVNTSIRSSLPMSLLEAAATGCAIVTTATCAIPELFTHNENCLMSNDADELKAFTLELMNNPTKVKQLGNAARLMVERKLPMQNFINNWNNVFFEAKRTPFTELL